MSDVPHAYRLPPRSPIELLTDDVLRHELVDWALVLEQEHGKLPRSSWAQIDELLDELGRRLGQRCPCSPESGPCPYHAPAFERDGYPPWQA